MQSDTPSSDHESPSLLTKTCYFPFLIFHMLSSVRCHLIIVLINVSLITIDSEHFFKHLLDFELSSLWNHVLILCIFQLDFMSFSWGFSVFSCRYEFLVTDVSNIFPHHVNFVYCILHLVEILHFDIVIFLSPLILFLF